MIEDRTWCIRYKCRNKECDRHPGHIKCYGIPHSFADFKDSEYCIEEELMCESEEKQWN